MSTRTHFTGISKKIELQSGVVKELVFNDPFDVNAFKTKLETGGSEIVVNQTFNAIRIDNPSDYNCWFTFYKGIAPSPTAEDNVFGMRMKDKMYLAFGIRLIKISSGTGNFDIYITLYA